MAAICVIICTHNPRPDYLRRVLDALQAQTMAPSQWELLLIDNASNEPLADSWNLSWHPQARHFREDELGLTPARLRGIRECKGELLVFVDDDNLLAPDYLECATLIADQHPFLGAFGGQITGVFEQTPPSWIRQYFPFLVIRSVERDVWSNLFDMNKTVPVGAGLCVRHSVARKYAEVIAKDPLRAGLDRKGLSLLSGGDLDLALTACDMNLGTGLFGALRMSHLIPANRLTKSYVVELVENIAYSSVLVDYIRGRGVGVRGRSWRRRLFQLSMVLLQVGIHRRIKMAHARGEAHACSDIRNHMMGGSIKK